jgi:hypothetical protein
MTQAHFTCALNLAAELPLTTDASGVVDLGAADSNRVAITGVDPTSHFGSEPNCYRIVRFVSATPLVNSSALRLLSNANRTALPGSYGSYLSDDDGNWAEIAYSPPSVPFGPGTAMLFVQAAAPIGWTKSTAHDDKAIRIVSGATGGGAGGATAGRSWCLPRSPS